MEVKRVDIVRSPNNLGRVRLVGEVCYDNQSMRPELYWFEVEKKYEKYLLSRSDLLKALPELKDKVIACWCAPKPCHGHILKKHAEAILS